MQYVQYAAMQYLAYATATIPDGEGGVDYPTAFSSWFFFFNVVRYILLL